MYMAHRSLLVCLTVLVPLLLGESSIVSQSQVHAGDRVVMTVKTLRKGDFQFEWFRDGTVVHPGKLYSINSTATSSSLTVRHFEYSKSKFVVYKAVAKDADGSQYEAKFTLPTGSAIIGFNTSRKNEVVRQSVTRNEGESLELTCLGNSDTFDNHTVVSWKFKKENGATFEPLQEGISTIHFINDTVNFTKLEKSDRGTLQCIFVNESKDIFLRVKDKYAVLYPFIGIILEVVLLVVIILTCERQQMKKKKKNNAAMEDENTNQSLINKNNKADETKVKQRATAANK